MAEQKDDLIEFLQKTIEQKDAQIQELQKTIQELNATVANLNETLEEFAISCGDNVGVIRNSFTASV